jgi:Fe-S-cluster containining protein
MVQKVMLYTRKELLASQREWKDVASVVHGQIQKKIATVEGLACKPGCAHCCKLLVHCLPHEAVDVVEYIRFSDRFTREQRAQILERLRAVVKLTAGVDANVYRALDVACPFLGEDHRCMVYPVRPLACHAFGSTDVAVCKLEKEDDGRSTFKAVPDSLLRLGATSGLFYTDYLRACLDWWEGEGVTARPEEDEIVALGLIRAILEAQGVT